MSKRTEFYLFGHKVSHSASPAKAFHNQIFSALELSQHRYQLHDTKHPQNDPDSRMLKGKTLERLRPIKVEAMKHVDKIADEAKEIGSISTIVVESIDKNGRPVLLADKHAEEMISTAILKKHPKYKIIGEESYPAGQDKRFLLTKEPTWIIDSLEGTVNYVHLFSKCCVSVGFCVNKVPVAGAIFAPIFGGLHPTNASGSLYSAAQALGSWILVHTDLLFLRGCDTSFDSVDGAASPLFARNAYTLPRPSTHPTGSTERMRAGKSASRSRRFQLEQEGSNFAQLCRRDWETWWDAIARLGRLRDMVYIATGAVDIFREGGCWEWDICAGIIVVNEAGGRVVPSQCPAGLEEQDDIAEADLESRLYLANRPCASTKGETATQAQDRLIREVWRRCEKLDCLRPQ